MPVLGTSACYGTCCWHQAHAVHQDDALWIDLTIIYLATAPPHDACSCHHRQHSAPPFVPSHALLMSLAMPLPMPRIFMSFCAASGESRTSKVLAP